MDDFAAGSVPFPLNKPPSLDWELYLLNPDHPKGATASAASSLSANPITSSPPASREQRVTVTIPGSPPRPPSSYLLPSPFT